MDSECVTHSGTSKISQIPPCRVCGEKSSGFHYGANTCEACKVFFMRNVDCNQKLMCSRKKLCQIKVNRRSCTFCRLQRCRTVGMSKNAIRFGRYTLLRHSLNNEEILKCNSHFMWHCDLNTSSSGGLYKSMASYLSNASKAHDVFDLVTRDATALHKQQLDYLEWRSACNMTIGQTNALSESEYTDFVKATGLDIDNRKGILMKSIKLLQDGITKQVKFAKNIPGFRNLSLADQVNVIKASASDYSRLCAARCLNAEVGVGTVDPWNSFYLDDVIDIIDESFLRQSFALAGKIAKLGLLDEEIAVLKAVCMTFTDRMSLEDKSAVDDMQWNLIGCLCWLLKRNHSNGNLLFYKIWNCVLLLRELNQRFIRHVENLRKRLPDDAKVPLFREFSVS